jgi:hypothetical protein
LKKIAAAPPNEDISLRRLIGETRLYAGLARLGTPYNPPPPWEAQEPPPRSDDWRFGPKLYDFQVTLDAHQLQLLDQGYIVRTIVANRRCLVRCEESALLRDAE